MSPIQFYFSILITGSRSTIWIFSFLHWSAMPPVKKIKYLHMWGSVSGIGFLFYWFDSPSLCPNHIVLPLVSLYILISTYQIPLAWLSWKLALLILALYGYLIYFRINWWGSVTSPTGIRLALSWIYGFQKSWYFYDIACS